MIAIMIALFLRVKNALNFLLHVALIKINERYIILYFGIKVRRKASTHKRELLASSSVYS